MRLDTVMVESLKGVRRALRDRRGGTMVLTAVCLPMLLMVVGFAADYGFASYVNQGLGRAADIAAVTAVSQTASQTAGGYSNTSILQYIGTQIFAENVKQMKLAGVNSNVSVAPDGNGGVLATVTYSYAVPALFGGMFGQKTIPVSGSANSAAKPTTYVNYYILVDTSQSMGIGTSQDDMSTLYARVASYGYGSNGEKGCQFGCHAAAPGHQYSNEQLAHNFTPRVTLRIDSAVQAVQSMINTANSTVGPAKNIQFALYAMQANPMDHTQIKTVAPLSTNYSDLVTKAATIDLGDNDGQQGFGDTDFASGINAFVASLPSNGSGSSPASPQNFVFLITDGVKDTPGNSCVDTHCTAALDPATCNPIKAKATVGTIYTTYQPIMKNAQPDQYEDTYRDLVLPFAANIAPNVAACATSSTLALEAKYGTDIINAVQILFNRTLPQSARLN